MIMLNLLFFVNKVEQSISGVKTTFHKKNKLHFMVVRALLRKI